MSARLRAAVIGAGNMGANHVRIYSHLPMVQLVAVAEPNSKTAAVITNMYKVKTYDNYEKMLDQEELDMVSICVPTSLHFAVAKKCIQHNLHTLLEKPISTSLTEAQELLRLASKQKIKFLIGHVERHNPAVKKVKELIKKRKLGKVTSIIARRVGGFPYQIRDASVMVDMAIHDIDIINFLLEELPQKIYSNKHRILIKKREDCVEYFLKYKNASAYVQTNWITPVKIRKLNITGSRGYLEMDYINQRVEFYQSNYRKFKDPYQNFSDYILRFSEPDKIDITIEKKEPLKEELIYFIESIRKNRSIDSTFALDAIKIALN